MILDILNGWVGSANVKERLMDEINFYYAPFLMNHLNREDLFRSTEIKYTYGDITIELSNFVKDFKLTNDTTHGVEAYFIYGVENST